MYQIKQKREADSLPYTEQINAHFVGEDILSSREQANLIKL